MLSNTKICRICNKELPIENFDFAYSKNKRHINPQLRRNDCKKCRVVEAKNRRPKNYYKERYWSMNEAERKEYSKTVYKRASSKPGFKDSKKNYDLSDKGIFNRYVAECNRRNRLKNGIKMLMTFEEFAPILGLTCVYCSKMPCRGVDRLDSSKSYSIENTEPCCSDCNGMKSDMTKEHFIEHLNKIFKNIGIK